MPGGGFPAPVCQQQRPGSRGGLGEPTAPRAGPVTSRAARGARCDAGGAGGGAVTSGAEGRAGAGGGGAEAPLGVAVGGRRRAGPQRGHKAGAGRGGRRHLARPRPARGSLRRGAADWGGRWAIATRGQPLVGRLQARRGSSLAERAGPVSVAPR